MANFGMKITLFPFFRMKIKFVLAVFVWALMVFGQHSFAQEMIDGVYHISSVEDLKSFAERVNNGENTANAILTCDLDLDNKPHTPIGSNESPYMGHFDVIAPVGVRTFACYIKIAYFCLSFLA